MRRRLALGLIYGASCFLAMGGLGDQFVRRLLGVHHAFLGSPPPSPLLERTETLVMLMLHVLGSGLMAAGVACFCMTHFALRRGHAWARGAIFLTVTLSEGANAYGMFRAQSYWQYPVTVVALMYVGLVLYVPESTQAPREAT